LLKGSQTSQGGALLSIAQVDKKSVINLSLSAKNLPILAETLSAKGFGIFARFIF